MDRRTINLVEDLSSFLIDATSLVYREAYNKFVKSIYRQMINTGNVTVPPLAMDKPIVITSRASYLMSKSQLALTFPKSKKYADIRVVMARHGVRSAKNYANILVTLATNPERDPEVARIFNENAEQVEQIIQTNKDNLREINKRISSNTSKQILRRMRQLSIPQNGQILTPDEIRTELRREFRNTQAAVDRIVTTETHRQIELTKELTAIQDGYSRKTWNTQRDNRVRESHSNLDRTKVGIRARFNVGGHMADYPGDASLPPHESINCRCFLTFD
jgi:hypothetical protein